MDKPEVLNQLILDVRAFLLVLDKETLTPFAQEQKRSISDLLTILEDAPMEDAEYMIMTCPSGDSSSQKMNRTADMDGELSPGAGLSQAEESSSSFSPERLLRGKPDPVEPSFFNISLERLHEGTELLVPVTGMPGGGLSEGPGPLPEVDHLTALHPSCFGGPSLWLPMEETLVRPVEPAAVRHPQPHSAVLQVYEGPSTSAGAESGRLPCDLQVQAQREGATPAEVAGQLPNPGPGLPQLAPGPGVAEGLEVIEEVSSSEHSLPVWQHSSRIRAAHPDDSCSAETVPSAKPTAPSGFLSVFMHCQWQTLWCRMEAGALRMSRDEASGAGPRHSLPLHGCDVRPGPDTPLAPRITVTRCGDQLAILEASSEEDRQRWLVLLQKGATRYRLPPHNALRGPRNHTLPNPDTHTADSVPEWHRPSPPQLVHCNASVVQHSRSVVTREPENWNRYSGTADLCQGRRMVAAFAGETQMHHIPRSRDLHPKVGSKMNLLTGGRQPKTASLRKSQTICSDKNQVGWLNLLRRTTSASSSLKRK
ncbi:actin filament-associated protein 1-like 2 isoform X4 [Brienomyrus brachyistius]|uniref:actin filament-associated protein 1-like 2 isoform X4 n=1 Tax=Brienomyrus brachyistius TaxID=42636 RepID=UPI0020B3D434|nr:actin filament-associated protein 1-like 2 isoform X4 [Brienomyrus brachyistius]